MTTAAASGAKGTVAIQAAQSCSWTAASTVDWIVLTSTPSGTGSGEVEFTVSPNTGQDRRVGAIGVSSRELEIAQDGLSCHPTLDRVADRIGHEGGTLSSSVNADTGCSWTAASNDGWIALTSSASGSGNATVTFTVAANPGPARAGTLTIAGQTFTVDQASGCSYSISPTSQSPGAAGGAGSTALTTAGGCGWTAASNDGWIALTSSASGSGNATVTFTVAANPGPARAGTLTIAGQTFTVDQASGCSYSISPTSQSPGAAGGAGSTALTTAGGCGWTAASNAGWIALTSSASGSGSDTVTFTVAANTGPARTGTLAIAGQTFTVDQASGCTYSISPTSQSPGAGGGAGSTALTTAGGCGWTAASNDGWITLTSSASGSGSDTVTFNVAANTGAARTGTLTIAGQTFTVNQASGCTYSISPTSQSPGAAGGAGSTALTTAGGCGWTAASNDGWITLTSSTSGSGSDTVTFTVAANTSPARTGTLTIAGQTFTVNQANGCTYSISPTSQSPGAAGGAGSTAVTAGSGCGWTAASNDGWITLTSSANGSGNDTATFNVAANTTPARTGTLTIAGRTFTVNQANGCTYSISPTSQSLGVAGGTGSVDVTAGAGCAWTAVSNDLWIAVTGGTPGSGNGTVSYLVVLNGTLAPRTGTITIGGQTFTINQSN